MTQASDEIQALVDQWAEAFAEEQDAASRASLYAGQLDEMGVDVNDLPECYCNPAPAL